jgi:hypothetical protein
LQTETFNQGRKEGKRHEKFASKTIHGVDGSNNGYLYIDRGFSSSEAVE